MRHGLANPEPGAAVVAVAGVVAPEVAAAVVPVAAAAEAGAEDTTGIAIDRNETHTFR
jgi:hypothetical protein